MLFWIYLFFYFSDTSFCWDENRKLTWDDFQGRPEKIETFMKVNAGALTNLSISYKFHLNDEGEKECKVIHKFMKETSWVINKLPLLLQHEQLHFDISELYVRKMRKTISSLPNKGNMEIKDYDKIINNLMDELDSMQLAYDIETGHGGAEIMQVKWNEKIAKELSELAQFASSSEDCE